MANTIGTDYTGTWTAAQFVIDMQYSLDDVQTIAELGNMDQAEESKDLTTEQRAEVVAYCKAQVSPLYALVSDCTPSNGTIVAISNNAGVLIDLHTDDTMRAIRVGVDAKIGDRLSIDWDTQRVNLAECL